MLPFSLEVFMFNLKPENMTGDTNKLLFAILTELKQLNESVQSLRPIAKDVVVEPEKVVEEKPKQPKKGVVRNVNSRQTRKLSKV